MLALLFIPFTISHFLFLFLANTLFANALIVTCSEKLFANTSQAALSVNDGFQWTKKIFCDSIILLYYKQLKIFSCTQKSIFLQSFLDQSLIPSQINKIIQLDYSFFLTRVHSLSSTCDTLSPRRARVFFLDVREPKIITGTASRVKHENVINFSEQE